MVTEVTNFGRSGLSDWVVQRVTGVVLLAYAITVACYLYCAGADLTYEAWKGFFSHTAMQVFSTAALLSVAAHGWIGMWAISTDYMTERMMGAKGTFLRLLFQAVCIALIFVYVVWGMAVVWS